MANKHFAEAKCALGKLLADRMAAAVTERQASEKRTQKNALEAAAGQAYETMLKTDGVTKMRDDGEKTISAIRRIRFTEAEVAKIKEQQGLLEGKFAKTKQAKDVQQVLKCFAMVRPCFPLEVDQATLDKAIAKMNKDNPKEVIKAKFEVIDDGLSLTLANYLGLVDLSGLPGLPITYMKIENCNALEDLSPLRGMPLEMLNLRDTRVPDLSPIKNIKGLELER